MCEDIQFIIGAYQPPKTLLSCSSDIAQFIVVVPLFLLLLLLLVVVVVVDEGHGSVCGFQMNE
jgi:hypothetical protein